VLVGIDRLLKRGTTDQEMAARDLRCMQLAQFDPQKDLAGRRAGDVGCGIHVEHLFDRSALRAVRSHRLGAGYPKPERLGRLALDQNLLGVRHSFGIQSA